MATFIPCVSELHLRLKLTWDQPYDVQKLVFETLEKHTSGLLSPGESRGAGRYHPLHLIGGEPESASVEGRIPACIVLPPRLHTLQAGSLLVLEWLRSPNVGHRAQQIMNLELFHLRFRLFRGPWVDVPSKYVESLTFDECHYISLLLAAKDHHDSGLNLQNLCRLKHLEIRAQLGEVPKYLLRFLRQLRLPARRTLESITLCLNFSPARPYDTHVWTSIDEALADAATYPRLRSIVISQTGWFKEHELGTAVTDLDFPPNAGCYGSTCRLCFKDPVPTEKRWPTTMSAQSWITAVNGTSV
ncbi:hypothetical protein GGX14DRAFT_409109 [Mycena pura]|uniref:Uncharacterized protein n=1 Tax=Mycena pura TaxID=153505 RepID=A0AAD6UKH5_9AGAR|nr:hypothetical protein GGX14DRAFT_409109 [Mycena pura]